MAGNVLVFAERREGQLKRAALEASMRRAVPPQTRWAARWRSWPWAPGAAELPPRSGATAPTGCSCADAAWLDLYAAGGLRRLPGGGRGRS